MKLSLKKLLLAAALLTALIAACTVSSLAAEVKLGQVKASSLRFRSQPSLDGKELGMIANGTKLLLLDNVEKGEWYKVVYNFNTGYVSAEYITVLADTDIQLGDGLSTGSNVNVRKSPNTSAAIITQLSKSQRVSVTGVSQGWFKVLINGATGYVHADYIEVVSPAASRGNDSTAEAAPVADSTPVADTAPASGVASELVAFAKKYLGCRYAYGGNGPKTFDCSGFTTFVYKNFGYSLNRTASGQLSNGKKVDKSSLQLGDLVMFRDPKLTKNAASHVGIYIGGNQFIHSSSSGGKVIITSLSAAYYAQYYIGARRVL